MNRTQLLKKLLPGFIPLFVFIAADEIWGTNVGIIVAVTVGIGEFAWVWIREKIIDRFILLDTALLVVLGGVSVILENDIFFKLKPGLVELILVAVLGISAFSPLNIVGLMSRRYMKDIEMNDTQLAQMRKSMKAMFFLFTLHTILVFYAAFEMSKEAWAFISGGLFYILFGVYFLFELVKQRFKKKSLSSEEWVPVVDSQGKIIGQATRPSVHRGEKILHPVVHLHVLNKKNLLLQKRSMTKEIYPGRWDTAVGGHILVNETLETALRREAFEELGLKDFSARLLQVYRWDSGLESELVYMFTTYDFRELNINRHEVSEAKFWTVNQLKKAVGEKIFTPVLEHELSILEQTGII